MMRKLFFYWMASLLWFTGATRADTDFIGLYLNWQRDPTTTMTVNWVNLYEHTTTNVWYRASGTEEWRAQSGTRHQAAPSTYQVRRVELTGLKPGVDYQFGIGDAAPEDDRNLYRFRTMPGTLSKPVRFVNGGDMMHTREMMDAMNRQAARLDPDFALLGGDLAYENGTNASRYIDWFQSWTRLMRGKNGRLIPMVVAIGNHEVRGHYGGRIPDDAPYFYNFFPLPENRSYHALDFGKYLSLLILDSAHTQPIAGPQAEWLGQALAARQQQQFVFPAYHWPAYGTTKASPGRLPSELPRSIEIRTNWIPHFERHGVSCVFEHDHHTFKRTHPLRKHQRDDENGIIYLGDGAWGVSTRTPIAAEDAWYLVRSEARRHLFHVTLDPSGRIDVEAVDAEGEVFDRITIEAARTRPVAE